MRLSSPLLRWAKSARLIHADERGASAIEFALLAPLLVLACMATVDVGIALNQRMEIDHSLRAGSEAAMIDLGETEVLDVVRGVASESLTVQEKDSDLQTSSDALSVAVERFCACPEAVGAEVACGSGSCAGAAKPYLYYRLSAEKEYDPILLPKFPLGGSMLVQIE